MSWLRARSNAPHAAFERFALRAPHTQATLYARAATTFYFVQRRTSRSRSYGDESESAHLVSRNQAHCDESGDARRYVLMCGAARVRPRTSALHRLRASPKSERACAPGAIEPCESDRQESGRRALIALCICVLHEAAQPELLRVGRLRVRDRAAGRVALEAHAHVLHCRVYLTHQHQKRTSCTALSAIRIRESRRHVR